ncbi:MAG: sulfotransferase [Bacteroidetes bacterium]|nr:sulfotransferase [Bacteroidota bacterium]
MIASTEKLFFIVGNSRSGTTMMLRILDNHPQIFGLNELHFFEQLWSTADKEKIISKSDAQDLAARLLYIQRKGYMGFSDTTTFATEANTLVEEMNNTQMTGQAVYAYFMKRETSLQNKIYAVEKTPQNVFYIKEILELFPNARIINMVRDPRGIMLSQKRKWMRRKMGATFITKKEVIRLRINYHPITLSRLWNSSIIAANKFDIEPRVKTILFEDMLDKPTETAQAICQHFEIDFFAEMLEIPQASSSNEPDSTEKGINKKRAGNWKSGGLSDAELFFCQKISGDLMTQIGYPLNELKPNPFSVIAYIIAFPFKLGLALLVNLNRMKSIVETIKRRLN